MERKDREQDWIVVWFSLERRKETYLDAQQMSGENSSWVSQKRPENRNVKVWEDISERRWEHYQGYRVYRDVRE